MTAPALLHLPLELVLRIILYSDRDTLVAFTQVSKACKSAADRQLYRSVTLNAVQLYRLLRDFIGDGVSPPSPDSLQRVKSMERLEIIHYRSPALPLRLIWYAGKFASE